MGSPTQAGTDAQLELLEAEARVLETRLAELRSAIDALREQKANQPSAAVSLQPLAPHDPLRAKWKLGAGLSTAAPQPAPFSSYPAAGSAGQLRLVGHLSNGEAWERHIPLAALSRPGGLSIGRSPQEADIVLPDAGASRRHALLEMTPSGLIISDLGSTNGTYIGQQLLSTCERRGPVAHGMTLGLGATTLRLEFI